MSPRRVFPYIAATAFLTMAACSSGNPDREPFSGNPGRGTAQIFVTNLNFMEATVYGVTTGARRKLGIVPGKGEAVLTLPITFPTEIHMEIDIMAGPYCYTDRLTVDPGDEFELIIQQAGANLRCRLEP